MRIDSKTDYFDLSVDEPQDEYDSGKITLTFKAPRLHFAYYNNYRYSGMPKDVARTYSIREGIRAFMSLIEKELRHAAQQIENDEKKEEKS